MKAVILAGGKGTRLGLFDKPKPMVEIDGTPLLEIQILLLKRYGITNVILLTGFLSEKIEEYFGDGSKLGVKITYVKEEVPLSTAGAVKQLEGSITERFLVLYGDIILDFDIKSFIEFDEMYADTFASIIVHPNEHPYDSDLVEIGENNFVTSFLSKPHAEGLVYANNVNAAVYILSPAVFKYIEKDVPSDFGKDIFPKLVKNNVRIRAYDTPEYIKDLGTTDRLDIVTKAYIDGTIAAHNKNNKRAAIFIDRDGVVNKEVDNLRNIDDFELLPGVPEALKKINKSGYLAVLVTNQPVVAKGFVTVEELSMIHKKLETDLGNNRAFFDRIYYCPHHPDKGFEGEVLELKIDCDCRKPKPGMLLQAAKDLNIDFEKSFIIGDSTTDIMTGINAGVITILVKTGHAGEDKKFSCQPDIVANDLLDAVNKILNDYK